MMGDPLRRLNHCVALCTVLVGLLGACSKDESPAPPVIVNQLASELVSIDGPAYSALTGVWQSPSGDVFLAGGNPDRESGLVARVQNDVIELMTVPTGPMIWWVSGIDDQHVWACGDEGRILRFDGSIWTEEETGLDEKAVLWGIWARTPNDIWAVGGAFRRGGPKGLVLHSNGNGVWNRVEDASFPTMLNLYKVWGDATRLVIVGEGGTVITAENESFNRVQTGQNDLLFTIDGQTGGPLLAVGGLDGSLVIQEHEGTWSEQSLASGAPLNGVAVHPTGQALAVGARGTVLYRDEAGHWYPVYLDARETIRDRTLHAAEWEDEIWIVGGDLTDLTRGVALTNRQPVPRWEFP